MFQATLTTEGAQYILRLSTPQNSIIRIPFDHVLLAAARQLRGGLPKQAVDTLGVDDINLAVGFALGRWAPDHAWHITRDEPFACFDTGLLTLGGAEFPGATIALPTAIDDAVAVLRGASRSWAEPPPGASLGVSSPAMAAGVILGMALGVHEPEVVSAGQISPGIRPQKGPMPPDVLKRLEPLFLEILKHIRYDMPVDKTIQEAQASPIAQQYPQAFAEWLKSAQQRGRKEKRAVDELKRLTQTHGPDAREVRAFIDKTTAEWRAFTHVAQKHLDFVRSGQQRRDSSSHSVRSRVQAGTVDHRLQAQTPAPHWSLYIDESGDGGRKVFDQSRAALQSGYAPWLVGVVVPQGSPLLPLPRGFHARNILDPDTLDTHMQDLLDAPAGILGLKVSAVPMSHGNAWLLSALELVRWTIRLLPLAGSTQIDVCIEQRGQFNTTTSIQAIADEMMRQLADVDPARAAQLQLNIRFVAKDASLHLGYADLLAFVWGQNALHGLTMLKQSGLLGTCLLAGDAAQLRQTWENIGAGRRPDAAAWQGLIENADARVPNSLVRSMLDRVADMARSDAGYWRSLCEGVLAHLDGRDVRLVTVGNAVAELERCRPDSESLTPRLELAFRTARLWHANHLGAIDAAEAQALDALGARLFEEVPALVCQADLVRAVAHTNLFDFDEATAALHRWQHQRSEVAGLQHHGRVLSTLGQHAAFRRQPQEALEYFDDAIACFGRLSEPAMGAREIWQTGTYRAIAAQDAGDGARDIARQALERQIGPLTLDSIARWPVRRDEAYLHHTLVRWLIACGTPEERSAYREAGGIWARDAYHPWPLIEAYRGLLFFEVGDNEQAAGFLESGISIALEPHQGPTVRFIGTCLARLAHGLGLHEVDAAIDREVTALRTALPAAPWDAWDAPVPLNGLSDAWQWLGRALPFNFR